MKHKPVFPFVLIAIICFSSAMAFPGQNPPRLIMGNGLMGSEQLVSFFMENNPDADEQRVARIAALYIAECAFEGVNSDVAFVQMCLETGFLRFQGLVSVEMNNFCGLGAVRRKVDRSAWKALSELSGSSANSTLKLYAKFCVTESAQSMSYGNMQ